MKKIIIGQWVKLGDQVMKVLDTNGYGVSAVHRNSNACINNGFISYSLFRKPTNEEIIDHLEREIIKLSK